MGFSYNVNVLNQKGSPAIYTDTFANRPPFGFAGRLFIANDTSAIYEDTGTAWVLIANVSSGAGTLQQVTTNGNTSNVGISVTAGGVSTNALTVTSLTPGSVPFVGTAGLVTQDNPNLFWDDTNNRFGINTNTPGNSLDVHSAASIPMLALNNTAANQSAISFLNNSVAKWRVGNTSNNDFEVFNTSLGIIATSIGLNNAFTVRGPIKLYQGGGFSQEAGYTSIAGDSNGIGFRTGASVNTAFFIFTSLTGQRGFTFPDQAGTIALTSDLSAYLPLTGGTLTGTTGNRLTLYNSGNNSGINGLLIDSDIYPGISFNNRNTTIGTAKIVFNTSAGGYGADSLAGAFLLQGSDSMQFATGANNVRMSILDSNNILFNTTSASPTNSSSFIFRSGSSAFSGVLIMNHATTNNLNSGFIDCYYNTTYIGGIAQLTSTTIAFFTTSDYRLKEDLKDFNALDLICNIKVYDFKWKAEDSRMYGVIAHELQEIIPYVISGNKDELKEDGSIKVQVVDYSKIVPILIKSTQELQSKIDKQNTLIQSLIDRIELLENK
jgi:hypothetical protein